VAEKTGFSDSSAYNQARDRGNGLTRDRNPPKKKKKTYGERKNGGPRVIGERHGIELSEELELAG